jgi:COP9 signalosome complex subunit 7
MSALTAELTEGSSIQQYVLLSKSAKAKACAAVIQQALNAPNVYVFGELLEMPNVQQLAETEDKKMLDLLKIFAYGTYADYKGGQFPPLTPAQTKKLRQLTLVSLSAQSKVIPYSVLQQQLDMSELRELEDLIIDAVYQGIINGQLDQKKKQLEVESSMGRDIRPEALDDMMQVLTDWSNQADGLLKTIKEKISHANLLNENRQRQREEFEKRVDTVKSSLKAAMEADLIQAAEFDEGMYDNDRRKGRSKKNQQRESHHPPHHRDRKGGGL